MHNNVNVINATELKTYLSIHIFSFPLIISPLFSKPFVPTLFMEKKGHTSELSLQTYSPLFPFVHATLQPIWLLQSPASEVKSLGANVLGVKLGKGGEYLCFQYSGHIYLQNPLFGAVATVFNHSWCPPVQRYSV